MSKQKTADPDLNPKFSFVDNVLLFVFVVALLPSLVLQPCGLFAFLYVMFSCVFVTFHMVPWVRCGT